MLGLSGILKIGFPRSIPFSKVVEMAPKGERFGTLSTEKFLIDQPTLVTNLECNSASLSLTCALEDLSFPICLVSMQRFFSQIICGSNYGLVLLNLKSGLR